MKLFFNKSKRDDNDEPIKKGDHLIRWTNILLWPVQVHAICIGVRKGVGITIVDFGIDKDDDEKTNEIDQLVKQKQEEEKDRNNQKIISAKEENDSMCFLLEDQAMIQAAQKFRQRTIGQKRITVRTLPVGSKEINQWRKVEYDSQRSWWWWRRDEKNIAHNVAEGNMQKGEKRRGEGGKLKLPKSDPTGIVLARIRYLLEYPNAMPAHHILYSNSECIAVWCKTGHFWTLQASVFLHSTAAGNLKSAATIGVAASTATTTITVPATGIAGWFGVQTTATVGLLTVHPWIVPVLATYGVVTVGAPFLVHHSARERWKETTANLTNGFWEWAKPDVFVEAIKSWSTL